MDSEHVASAVRELFARITDRRRFLRDSTLTAFAGAAVACKGSSGANSAQAGNGPAKDAPTGGTMGANDTARASATAAADAMDAMHEKAVKAFPAATAGRGNQPLTPTVKNGVKVYKLDARVIQWEVLPGQMATAWAYNNQVPGPVFRVKEGDRVRVQFTNNLPESTAIHWHGLEIANDQDGVPFEAVSGTPFCLTRRIRRA